MSPWIEDPFRELAEAFAAEALHGRERSRFAAHVARCGSCRRAVARGRRIFARLPRVVPAVPPVPSLRAQVLDLARAPGLPITVDACTWDEPVSGVRVHVVKEEPRRGMRACLVWARPGARNPEHRHLGDENILVLQGRMRDERATYGPGQVCRSRAGSVHSEEALPGADCVCYVVYYGGLAPVSPPA